MSAFTTRRSRVSATRAVFVLLLGAVSAPARAQPQIADTVVMINGDRLTGDIKSLSKGKLSFDTKATGVVSVKWEQVAEVTSVRLFEVETEARSRLLGRLAPAGPGKIALVGDAGQVVLDLGSIVGLAPMRRSFLNRLDGSFGIGGNYTQASGVAQLSLTLSVSARRPSFEWRLGADDYVTFDEDAETSQRFATDLGYSRYLSRGWAVYGWGQVERNTDLGFRLRGTIGGGLERTLVRTNRSTFATGAGLGASREVPEDGDTETLLPAMLHMRHSFFTYSTPKTSIDTTVTVFPILNQSGRWRIDANTSLSREIVKDFAIALSLYESYDSRPPSAEASQNDAGATLSVSFVF